MGVVEGVGKLGNEVGNFTERKFAGLQRIAQRNTVDELGYDGRQGVQDRDFENVDDVGMAKLCGCAGLAEESLAIGVAFQYARMRKLQSDEAIELSVARFPNRPEATDPHALQKLKFTELTHAARRAGQSSVPDVKVAATDGAE